MRNFLYRGRRFADVQKAQERRNESTETSEDLRRTMKTALADVQFHAEKIKSLADNIQTHLEFSDDVKPNDGEIANE